MPAREPVQILQMNLTSADQYLERALFRTKPWDGSNSTAFQVACSGDNAIARDQAMKGVSWYCELSETAWR